MAKAIGILVFERSSLYPQRAEIAKVADVQVLSLAEMPPDEQGFTQVFGDGFWIDLTWDLFDSYYSVKQLYDTFATLYQFLARMPIMEQAFGIFRSFPVQTSHLRTRVLYEQLAQFGDLLMLHFPMTECFLPHVLGAASSKYSAHPCSRLVESYLLRRPLKLGYAAGSILQVLYEADLWQSFARLQEWFGLRSPLILEGEAVVLRDMNDMATRLFGALDTRFDGRFVLENALPQAGMFLPRGAFPLEPMLLDMAQKGL